MQVITNGIDMNVMGHRECRSEGEDLEREGRVEGDRTTSSTSVWSLA
jgi:hypothetical protein